MENILRDYIRKQVAILLESASADDIEVIRNKEAEVADANKEIENVKKLQNDTRLQQQNKQKVVGTQVGTLGDPKSKDIKSNDIKSDVQLYKDEFANLKNKEQISNQALQAKKNELDAAKAKATSITSATAPTTPSAPTTP